MKQLTEYEVNFDHWNILWKKHENRYDKFTCESNRGCKGTRKMEIWRLY